MLANLPKRKPLYCSACKKECEYLPELRFNDKLFCSDVCMNKEKEYINNKKALELINKLPLRFRTKTLETFKNLPEKITEYLKDPKSLLLSGCSGTGKTHIACGIYQKLAELGKNVLFCPSIELIYDIRESVKDNIDEKIKYYTKFDYLIIDDIGTEKMTDWIKEIFYLIIDRQYRDMKNIIITTNMNSDEMSKNFDYRIVSRLIEMGKVVKFDGKDYRITNS